ncbi:unnamed protein product [Allacma fusca]|uniref:Uncharacterized protein n=1 Tax=Allacma fusca TaxID=39272 RepID=A0A8J2LT64_9HEXA|nr:unnamed protein product [Allacma fusca]
MAAKKVSVIDPRPSKEAFEESNGRFQIDQVNEDDVGETLSNQNTYIPHNNKTISQLTREAQPSEKHYDETVNRVDLPSMDYLHNRTVTAKSKPGNLNNDKPPVEEKMLKFGWMEGVLMPCLLNIWGVMLFLRLSWVVGQAGVWQGFCLITVANVVTFITALSMSAVSTNGKIKGGGIYYMISRSLGPEFGAAIGLMFTLANSIAVAMYVVGFCESLNDLLRVNNWGEIVDGGVNDIRIVGSAVLVFILILSYVGMEYVSKTQIILLFILFAAEADFMVGTIIGPVSDTERAQGFTGFSKDTWDQNFNADYRVEKSDGKEQSFFSVFGVFFPAVTGIVAGANLSGNLKDPESAIPKGTLLAIGITYLSYIVFALMMGGSVLREATGDLDQYLSGLNISAEEANELGFKFYTDCQNGTDYICSYGLLNNPQVMELASSWGPLIYMGCFAATLSSAIASLIGAPRVLQALAKDKLYPFIHIFAKGYGKNNDPVRGYVLVFAIALGCTLIGKLNAIAPLLSNFFLAAYCLINFSCFHGSIAKSPGWRPAFKYYNAWLSLLGSLLCVAVMFLMSWVTALVTVGLSIFLYMYVSYRAPNVNWGSSTQAQSYNSALSSVQTLNQVEDHVKNYRPQILILTGMPSSRPTLIDFSHLLVKNLSLFICGQVVQGRLNQRARNQLTRQAQSWLAKHKKKGFYSFYENDKFDEGARSIMQLAGLGKLKPNLTLMGYKHNWTSSSCQDIKEYVNVIHESLNMHLGVGILRIPGGLDYSQAIHEEGHMSMEEILDLAKPSHVAPKIPLKRQDSETETSDEESSEEDNPSPKPDEKTDKVQKKTKDAKKSKEEAASLYTGLDGTPLPSDMLAKVTQFTKKQKKGTIDVWWLYDDGGLTILIPYILSTRSEFSDCQLRIFTITGRLDQLGSVQRNMAALLSKFRIDYSDVIVIPDITAKAKAETKKEFDDIISPFMSDDSEDGSAISSAEMVTLREKTNRHLRLREMLLEYSKDASFVVMSLPIPRLSTVSPPMYMGWLEIMTRDMPPFLLVRGNQTSVLTFFS